MFVALDFDTRMDTRGMIQELDYVEGSFGYKINLDLLITCGVDIVYHIKNFTHRPLFVDLKMWNGSRIMMKIIKDLDETEVNYTNVHARAGYASLSELTKIKRKNVKILALTTLSHNINSSHLLTRKEIRGLSTNAKSSGCDGIIVPPSCLNEVKDLDILKVTPAIRPDWYKRDDRHTEPTTPTEALKNGANILVVGSPITRSIDPVMALKHILREISGEEIDAET